MQGLHSLLVVTLLVPSAALAELPDLSCTLTEDCTVGQPCTETALDFDFDLKAVPGGYGATVDSGWVEVMQVSPPEAEVKSFLLSGPESVTVMLSIFPDGAIALTVHEDIDGRHVETAFGRCVEEI
jgi:hypothetical protein